MILILLILSSFEVLVNCDSCITCDSSDIDACVGLEMQILARSCQNNSSPCYTRIEDGKTVRGCLYDLEKNEIDLCRAGKDCAVCSSTFSGCNSEPFPKHRLQCLRCSGSLNSSCAYDVQQSMRFCSLYVEKDQCIIYKSEKKDTFVRECLSSFKDLCGSGKGCYFCDGDGCNHLERNSKDIPNEANKFLISYFGIGMSLLLILKN